MRASTWFVSLCLNLLFINFACSPASEEQGGTPSSARSARHQPVPILFWNLENYFDATDDPHGHDNDRRSWWTADLYQQKTDHLLEILGPFTRKNAILTFAEIEHRGVLEDLRKRLPGGELYHIVYQNIRHARIKQGALSPYKVKKINSLDYLRGQRPILEMHLDLQNETLIVFINHWKSRMGGQEATEARRMAAGNALYRRILKLRNKDPLASIVVLGDFNDEPKDRSLRKSLHSHPDRVYVQSNPSRLWNCLQEAGQGSHVFRGQWQLLDQILIGPALLDNKGMQVDHCEVYNARGNLVRQGRPWRFGGRGVPDDLRGYSDHLPVVVYLK